MSGRKRTSGHFHDSQLNDHSLGQQEIPTFSRPQIKRNRTSNTIIEPQSAKLIEQRKVFLDQLRDHLPFLIQYRDQAPSHIRKSVSTPHSINQPSEHGIRVWITGLNVDNEVFTLKKSTGLIVLVEYRPHQNTSSSPSCYYQSDALSSSALCTFLAHVHTGEINQTQLINFFRSTNANRTLLSITARFPLINGFTRLIYVNTYNQLALLADLFTRGVRVRNNQDIPKLTKMLKPKKEVNIPNHSAAPQIDKIVASPYASRQHVASINSSSSAQSKQSTVRSDEHEIEFDSLSDDDSASDSPSPHSSPSELNVQSQTSSHVPFSEYDFVLTWWCDLRSPSYARISSLFASLSSAHPKVGVCELTCEDVDVELVLTRMGIRILSALSAPTVRASSQSDRQREIMDHLQSKLQPGGNKLSAPLPLRLEDACLVIAERQFFVRTVYPFIVRPNTMYELTIASPALEFCPTASVKIENMSSHISVQQNVAELDNKARVTSIELVSSHIRRACSPSSFMLYSMQPSTPSLFFAPVHCKSIYSMAAGHLIERPCVIEWPSHLPFNSATFVQWCQFHVRFGSVSHVMVVIPCRCWQLISVTDMRTAIAKESLIGQQHQRFRASHLSSAVPSVILKSVLCSARPALLLAARQNKLQILDESHFFVAHFHMQAGSSSEPTNVTISRAQASSRSPTSLPPSLEPPLDDLPHLSPATPRYDSTSISRSQSKSHVARPLTQQSQRSSPGPLPVSRPSSNQHTNRSSDVNHVNPFLSSQRSRGRSSHNSQPRHR